MLLVRFVVRHESGIALPVLVAHDTLHRTRSGFVLRPLALLDVELRSGLAPRSARDTLHRTKKGVVLRPLAFPVVELGSGLIVHSSRDILDQSRSGVAPRPLAPLVERRCEGG